MARNAGRDNGGGGRAPSCGGAGARLRLGAGLTGDAMRSGLTWCVAFLMAAWPACPPARAQEADELRIYNWADYIGHDTIAAFTRRTGIHVVYDTYESDLALDARVMAGAAGYDLVTASTAYFGRQIRAGKYQPIDRAALPNWKNLDPAVLAVMAREDPGNRYAVPYLHGVNGFIYNAAMIRARAPRAPAGSLDMVFRPDLVAKFADCGVSFTDSAEDVIRLALIYLHRDPNTEDPADLRAAEAVLMAVRPYVRRFDSEAFMNALPNQELCLAMAWSGDYETARMRAAEAGVRTDLRFTVPREGATISYDAWLMPKDAPHRQAALAFLNDMLAPRVIAQVTNDIHYGNDNLAARRYVSPALLNNHAIYPVPGMTLFESRDIGAAAARQRAALWARVKAARQAAP